MKAFGISSAEDVEALQPYIPHVDRFLLDAKPPKKIPIFREEMVSALTGNCYKA